MDVDQTIALRRQHAPQRRWWARHVRCAACGDRYPCAAQRFAQARIVQLLREVLAANAGTHW